MLYDDLVNFRLIELYPVMGFKILRTGSLLYQTR